MEIPLSFNGREYRLSVAETEQLAEALAARRDQSRWGIPDRDLEHDTFVVLAERLRQAVAPPVSAVELQAHEAAAVVLVFTEIASAELGLFYRDYAAENLWLRQPFSHVTTPTIEACFALKIGQWFFEDGLRFPIGGLDEETGEDLPPTAVGLAAHTALNAAFAGAASAWARIRGTTFSDGIAARETLAWLRKERACAEKAAYAASDSTEEAEANARAWALREAGLWLESCANRTRRPWEAPRHEA